MTTPNDDIDHDRRSLFLAGAAGLALAGHPTSGLAQASPAAPSERVLAGQVALVTGAARGIGRAIAVSLAEAGADVAGLDILANIEGHPVPMAEAGDLAETRRRVEIAGARFMPLQADIRDLQTVQEAVRRAESELGPIAVLAANAGVNSNVKFGAEDENAWRHHWDIVTQVNVIGTANTLRAVMPGMMRRGSGRIIPGINVRAAGQRRQSRLRLLQVGTCGIDEGGGD